jgi:RND family efflux transporter MFP subunit
MKAANFPVPRASARLLLALLGAGLAAGCHKQLDTASEAPVSLGLSSVALREIPAEVVAAGSIEAVDKSELGFLVGGRVLSVDAEDGAEVAAGQVLARLDPADYQHALEIAEARLAEVSARHVRLSRLHELGSLTATDFDKIESGLKEARNAAELARRQLGYTELKAPFAGRVVRRGIAVGQAVIPAQPLMTVLAPAPVWASVGVAEAQAASVRVGCATTVLVAAEGARVYEGPVSQVFPQADPLSRSFTVKVLLDNADRSLRPGNVVTAHILTGERRKAVLLPPQVVQKHPDGSLFVWLVDPRQGGLVRRQVDCGALVGSEVEVVSGLAAGDQVVTRFTGILHEGMRAREAAAR